MPKVSIDHKTTLPADEAFQKIKTFFESDQDIRKFDANMKSQFSESSFSGRVQGSQFKADIQVSSSSQGSSISVIVDLPLLLSPFKNKIQEMITKKLSKYLT